MTESKVSALYQNISGATSSSNNAGSYTPKSFACPNCDKTYPTLMALRGHQRNHSTKNKDKSSGVLNSKGRYDYICDGCGQSFTYFGALITHKAGTKCSKVKHKKNEEIREQLIKNITSVFTTTISTSFTFFSRNDSTWKY
jgi:DNA-directed RNA polymerase subunit RPC12/RpoP